MIPETGHSIALSHWIHGQVSDTHIYGIDQKNIVTMNLASKSLQEMYINIWRKIDRQTAINDILLSIDNNPAYVPSHLRKGSSVDFDFGD